jgi:hypothetical protein
MILQFQFNRTVSATVTLNTNESNAVVDALEDTNEPIGIASGANSRFVEMHSSDEMISSDPRSTANSLVIQLVNDQMSLSR